MTATGSDGKTIRAVERAVEVLRCFTRDMPTLSVTDLQRSLGLSRPTLYRLLLTLEGAGMVRSFGEPQRFQLAHGAIALGAAALGSIDVARVADTYLRALWEATDETVALFVPVSATLKACVQEIQSRQPLVFTRGAGFTEPTTVGASGKVMLAFMADADATAALSEVPDAPRATLSRELDLVRRTGYCVSTGEIIDGAVAIAAPIFEGGGELAGAASVYGPESRLAERHRDRCVTEVCLAADRISRAMGHRTPSARGLARGAA